MANDNTLGAPTEGLGQTVTFGFSTPGKPGARGVQRGSIRAGVQGNSGGGGNTLSPVRVEESETVAMLMKVGEGLIDKNIKEARTAAFVSGMQRAMSGEAIDDIAKNQPAWARVFGDSDAVEGARAYGAEKKVQDVLLKFEQEMPNLRQLSEKEANDFFVESVNKSLTGHTATDNAIMSSVQRNMPALMKRRSQEHYAYMQETAAAQEAEALAVSAERLQNSGTALAAGKITDEDHAEQVASLSMLAVPAQGRDPKMVKQQRTASAILMAEKGQFHALNALEQVGILGLLDPHQKASIERSRQTNEMQYRSQYGANHYEWLANIRNLVQQPVPGWTGNDSAEAMKEFNRTYSLETGSKTPYFGAEAIAAGNAQTTHAIDNAIKAQHKENERVLKDARESRDKTMARQAEDASISFAFANGAVSTLLAGGEVTEKDVHRWFLPRATSLISNIMGAKPEDLKLLTVPADGGYVSKPVSDQIGRMVTNAVVDGAATTGFVATYELWRKMNQVSPKAAAGYFKEDHAKFLRFNLGHPDAIDLKQPSPFLQQAFAGSFGPHAQTTRARMDKKEAEALIKETTSSLQGGLAFWQPEWLGGPKKLRPGVAQFIANELHPTMEVFATTGTPESALQAALQIVPQRGLRIVGGYAWKDAGKDFYLDMQERIGKDKFGLSSNSEVAEDFGDVMDEEIAKVGGMDSVHMYRDPVGDQLVATGWHDGRPVRVNLTMNGIAERLLAKQKKRREPVKVEARQLPSGAEYKQRSPEERMRLMRGY